MSFQLVSFSGEWGPFAGPPSLPFEDLQLCADPFKRDIHQTPRNVYLPEGGRLYGLTWESVIKTPGPHEGLVCLVLATGAPDVVYLTRVHHSGNVDGSVRGPFDVQFEIALDIPPGSILYPWINAGGPTAGNFYANPLEIQCVLRFGGGVRIETDIAAIPPGGTLVV